MNNELDQFVVIFGPEIWGLQGQGGISRYNFELIRNLELLGVNVRTLIGPNNNSFTPRINPSIIINIKDDSKKEISQAINFGLGGSQTGIYHSTYYRHRNIKIAQARSLRTVVTVHDLIGDLFPEKIRWYKRRNQEQQKCVKASQSVIAVSENTKLDLVSKYKMNPSDVDVIHLGVNTLKSKNIEGQTWPKPYLLHVGNRQGYKNFQITLDAISEYPNLEKLNVIAFGGGEFTESEIEYIKFHKLDRRVLQISGDDDLLGYAYQNAKALVYPSLYEGFGIPPLEAMRLKCPVVASNRASIPEVCGEWPIYFDPTSVWSLRKALENLIDTPQNYSTSKSFQFSSNYSWEKNAKKTLEIYSQLMKNN